MAVRRAAVTLCLLVTFGAVPLWADSNSREAREEMRFGYKVAREGYWQEALMRFRQADELQPNDPEILNNIAVALEATGDYDGAREVYGRALTIAPGNTVVRGNFQEFERFYKENVADLAPPEELPSDDETQPPASAETGDGDDATDDEPAGGDDDASRR